MNLALNPTFRPLVTVRYSGAYEDERLAALGAKLDALENECPQCGEWFSGDDHDPDCSVGC